MKETNIIKEQFLKLMIKHKIISTSLPFMYVADDFSFIKNVNNEKTFFLNEEEMDILRQLKRISYVDFNDFYYKWISTQTHVIKNKRRNKEHLITQDNVDILEIEIFNHLK